MPTVCIVDPRPEDFLAWQSVNDQVRLHVVSTAREALRLAAQSAISLWVVNCRLPDISGVELCQMLKVRDKRSTVYLLADEYSPEQERAAWQARANLFCVKTAHATCLSEWLTHRQTHLPACRNR